MVRAELGLSPWDVLHQGISQQTDIPIGQVGIWVGVVVLLGWVPLAQRIGLGTALNVVVIGLVIDGTLLVLDALDGLALRGLAMLAGVVLIGVGSGLYIGAGLGPGPRDGLMTGLAARGHSIRLVRTAMEMAVLVGGWLLGGTVGVGTVVFALAIGPLVHHFLAWLTLPAPVLTAPAQ
jgi:uncharacterized membrane protein YczE